MEADELIRTLELVPHPFCQTRDLKLWSRRVLGSAPGLWATGLSWGARWRRPYVRRLRFGGYVGSGSDGSNSEQVASGDSERS